MGETALSTGDGKRNASHYTMWIRSLYEILVDTRVEHIPSALPAMAQICKVNSRSQGEKLAGPTAGLMPSVSVPGQ